MDKSKQLTIDHHNNMFLMKLTSVTYIISLNLTNRINVIQTPKTYINNTSTLLEFESN